MPLPITIAIWKQKGPTSHDVVDAVRKITGERRVGHAGTLDPMAEGVLVVGIGRRATRKLKEIVGQEKEYVATIRLGATSTTDDAEGEISESVNQGSVSQEDIERTLPQFLGRIEQVPPAYSAVKVRGKPAHRRVRRGETIELKPRMVEIKEIELLEHRAPQHRVFSRSTPDVFPLDEETLTLRIVCGPGTYIRALARDIGRALGVGGYLTQLTRTRVGAYSKDNALTLEQFRERWLQIVAGQKSMLS